MKCRTCGVSLPPGAKVCPNCGTAVPRPDETVVDTPGQEPLIPPTIYGGPVPPAPSYNAPMQNPYERSSQPPPPPYSNQVSPLSSAPYNQTEPNQFQPGSFNQGQVAPGGYPNQYAGGNVPPPYPAPGYVPPQQQPRRKTRWGLIIGIIAGVLVLACIGASALTIGGLYSIGKTTLNAQATATARANTAPVPAANTTQPTPEATQATNSTSTGASPSGTPIDPEAATIITNAQPARGVDEITADPKNPTTTFKAGERVYVTFKLNNDKINPTTQPVYVGAKLYIDNELATKIDPITFDKPSPGGYFAGTYKVPGKGAAELYLCSKSDCSDGKLAQVATFTVGG